MRKVQSSDFVIGRNLRALRNRRGISQTELANRLGITFQQVQKYEKGSNRISASTLIEISKALNFELLDFFANATDVAEAQATGTKAAIATNKLDLLILRRLSDLQDDRIKKRLLSLLDSITEAEHGRSASRSPEQGGWTMSPNG